MECCCLSIDENEVACLQMLIDAFRGHQRGVLLFFLCREKKFRHGCSLRKVVRQQPTDGFHLPARRSSRPDERRAR